MIQLAKNHQINHYGLQIHGNHHCLCHDLYYDLSHNNHGHQNQLI